MPGGGGGAGGGTGAVTTDMLQREQEYQDAIRKRNQLLLDPNPVRAMEALREATRKAADEEERLGRAIRQRLGLGGGGVGGGAGGGVPSHGGGGSGSGPGVPANPYGLPPTLPPGPGGAGGQPGGGLGWGATAAPWKAGAGAVLGTIGAGVGKAMDAMDAAQRPFTAPETRFWGAVDSLDPTGAASQLRRLQLSLQQYGSGMSREDTQLLARRQAMLPGEVDLPLERFRMTYDVERVMAGVRAGDADHELGRRPGEPWRPKWMDAATNDRLLDLAVRRRQRSGDSWEFRTLDDGDRVRDTLSGERRYQEASGLLPAQRRATEETRELEAQKAGLEVLIGLRRRYDAERIAAAQRAAVLEKQANDEAGKNVPTAFITRAMAFGQSAMSAGFAHLSIEAEDRIKAARQGLAEQDIRERTARGDVTREKLRQLSEREGVASEQSQRVAGLGIGGVMEGSVALRQLQKMKAEGTLAMAPPELYQMAGRFAPGETRKLAESGGTDLIRMARDSGAAGSEFRDVLPQIRQEVDKTNRQLDTFGAANFEKLGTAILEIYTKMSNRFADYERVLESLLGRMRVEGIYQSTQTPGTKN